MANNNVSQDTMTLGMHNQLVVNSIDQATAALRNIELAEQNQTPEKVWKYLKGEMGSLSKSINELNRLLKGSSSPTIQKALTSGAGTRTLSDTPRKSVYDKKDKNIADICENAEEVKSGLDNLTKTYMKLSEKFNADVDAGMKANQKQTEEKRKEDIKNATENRKAGKLNIDKLKGFFAEWLNKLLYSVDRIADDNRSSMKRTRFDADQTIRVNKAIRDAIDRNGLGNRLGADERGRLRDELLSSGMSINRIERYSDLLTQTAAMFGPESKLISGLADASRVVDEKGFNDLANRMMKSAHFARKNGISAQIADEAIANNFSSDRIARFRQVSGMSTEKVLETLNDASNARIMMSDKVGAEAASALSDMLMKIGTESLDALTEEQKKAFVLMGGDSRKIQEDLRTGQRSFSEVYLDMFERMKGISGTGDNQLMLAKALGIDPDMFVRINQTNLGDMKAIRESLEQSRKETISNNQIINERSNDQLTVLESLGNRITNSWLVEALEDFGTKTGITFRDFVTPLVTGAINNLAVLKYISNIESRSLATEQSINAKVGAQAAGAGAETAGAVANTAGKLGKFGKFGNIAKIGMASLGSVIGGVLSVKESFDTHSDAEKIDKMIAAEKDEQKKKELDNKKMLSNILGYGGASLGGIAAAIGLSALVFGTGGTALIPILAAAGGAAAFARSNVVSDVTENVPSHRNGLNFVPYDEYPAYLHKGEMVLTRNEADRYRGFMEKFGSFKDGTDGVVKNGKLQVTSESDKKERIAGFESIGDVRLGENGMVFDALFGEGFSESDSKKIVERLIEKTGLENVFQSVIEKIDPYTEHSEIDQSWGTFHWTTGSKWDKNAFVSMMSGRIKTQRDVLDMFLEFESMKRNLDIIKKDDTYMNVIKNSEYKTKEGNAAIKRAKTALFNEGDVGLFRVELRKAMFEARNASRNDGFEKLLFELGEKARISKYEGAYNTSSRFASKVWNDIVTMHKGFIPWNEESKQKFKKFNNMSWGFSEGRNSWIELYNSGNELVDYMKSIEYQKFKNEMMRDLPGSETIVNGRTRTEFWKEFSEKMRRERAERIRRETMSYASDLSADDLAILSPKDGENYNWNAKKGESERYKAFVEHRTEMMEKYAKRANIFMDSNYLGNGFLDDNPNKRDSIEGKNTFSWDMGLSKNSFEGGFYNSLREMMLGRGTKTIGWAGGGNHPIRFTLGRTSIEDVLTKSGDTIGQFPFGTATLFEILDPLTGRAIDRKNDEKHLYSSYGRRAGVDARRNGLDFFKFSKRDKGNAVIAYRTTKNDKNMKFLNSMYESADVKSQLSTVEAMNNGKNGNKDIIEAIRDFKKAYSRETRRNRSQVPSADAILGGVTGQGASILGTH